MLQMLLNKFQFQMKMTITIASRTIMGVLDLSVLIKREMHQFEIPLTGKQQGEMKEMEYLEY